MAAPVMNADRRMHACFIPMRAVSFLIMHGRRSKVRILSLLLLLFVACTQAFRGLSPEQRVQRIGRIQFPTGFIVYMSHPEASWYVYRLVVLDKRLNSLHSIELDQSLAFLAYR